MPTNNASLITMRPYKAAVMTSGAVLGGITAAAAYGSASKSSQLFGPSIYRGPGRRRTVALTFDDGPSEGTLRLLELLHRENVFATFFLCGMNVRRLPSIAGQVAAAGHQIGNHTYSHPRLPLKPRGVIEQEFTQAQRIIMAETGMTPMILRPPYGLRWAGMRGIQNRLSLLGVLWTVIGNDWKLSGSAVAQRVLRRVSPGGIICLHDGRAVQPAPDIRETIEAVRLIIPILKDHGYGFEVVTDLIS
jgi:peptidoglycan-N-acetylglucosamine deacetylase